MKIRLRIAKGRTGKTLFLEVPQYPRGSELIEWVAKNHPGWNVVGWCEACIIEQAVSSWLKGYSNEDLLDGRVKILGSQVLINEIPFASVTLEGDDSVTIRFYNYNFKWGVNRGSIKNTGDDVQQLLNRAREKYIEHGPSNSGSGIAYRTKGNVKDIL